MREVCGETAPDPRNTNTHTCWRNPHGATDHECACGRTWPTPPKETPSP